MKFGYLICAELTVLEWARVHQLTQWGQGGSEAGRHLAMALKDEEVCFGFVWGFSCRLEREAHKKPRNRTIMWFSNSTPGYIPKKMKTLIWKDTHTPTHTFKATYVSVLSVCQQMYGWGKYGIYTQWNITLRKNEVLPYAATWMDLKVLRLVK